VACVRGGVRTVKHAGSIWGQKCLASKMYLS
jgi:hypothetical protein